MYMTDTAPQFDVVIVGSGFAGLCMAAKLRQAGIDNFVILEKDAELGGTWWANSYPGCAVDVPSHLYSFSFAQNTRWTRRFAGQQELLAYTRGVAREFGLEPHVRTGTELQAADFDEEGGFWRLRTSAGPMSAKCVVAAAGALNRAATPDIPGLATFEGAAFHSSRWDHGIELRGKRVAVIGTGASAIQFIPEIAGQVARLDVYQRTAPWILPRPDRAISRVEQWLLAKVAPLKWLYRAMVYAQYESRAILYVYRPNMLRVAEWMARRHLRSQVADPLLRAKLTPDYRLGCKRVLLMNTYYPALSRANVDVITDPIAAVRRNAVVTAKGEEREVDVIIFGTGFDVAQAMGAVDVRGRRGRRLFDCGPEAYKGCAVHGFPNYFMITGPNTGLGHNSMIYMIESAVTYVMGAVRAIRERGLHAVEVNQDAQREWNASVQRRMRGTVWSTGCRSWYLDRDGKNFTLWPGFTFTYRRLTRRFDVEHYTVVEGRGAAERPRPAQTGDVTAAS
jgi:cation diffusion facilitator CzcD-associated flavoprotein CzcO